MAITRLSFHKAIKKNLGNYNMLETSYGIEYSLQPEEPKPDEAKIWDEINRQISIQAGTIDPEWIRIKGKDE